MEEIEKIPEPEVPEAETVPTQEPEKQTVGEVSQELAEEVKGLEGKKLPVKKLVLLGAAAVVLIAAVVLFVVYGVPAIRYSNGVKAYENGEYAQAAELFTELSGYKEADSYLAKAELGVHYTNAAAMVQAGEYTEAIAEYQNAEDFLDARERLLDTYVLYGDSLLAQEKYDEAVEEYRHASENEKIAQAYDLKGEALFTDKQFVQAAEAFALADNAERRLDCGIALVEEQQDYTAAMTLLEVEESPEAAPYRSYANAMLSLETGDFQTAVNSFAECAGLLDADKQRTEATFLLAEKCLHEGYLNKALRLYTSLPEEYTGNGVAVSDRIALLNKNQKLLDLVGSWRATDTYYKVQADSTTSSYYYYWYQDALTLGTVTVTCPYNEDGTFTIKGTATFPSYQNFSSNASKLKTDMETFTFSAEYNGSIPYQVDSSSTTKLSFNGRQFDLQYKYVNKSSNVYWHYTFTSKVSYGTRSMLAEDK